MQESQSDKKEYQNKEKDINNYKISNDIETKINKILIGEESKNQAIHSLENKVNQIYNCLNRPFSSISYDNNNYQAKNYIAKNSVSNNSNFDNNFLESYLRKGEGELFITKALTSSEGQETLVSPNFYNQIIEEIYISSPLRQLASREVISSNSLDLIIAEGELATGWVRETEERKDTENPKLRKEQIFVHELYAQPKASQALIDDNSINIESWLARKLADSFLRAENEAFINGDGQNKPYGILNYVNEVENIEFKKEEFNADSLLSLINKLDENYLPNATFLMHRSVLSLIQKFKDKDGRFIWQHALSEAFKPSIFGFPVVCSSNMPMIDQQEKPIIAFGDFKIAYKIVDRSGINIMKDPYTEKPFVKFYSVKRVGADLIIPEALKFLKFAA